MKLHASYRAISVFSAVMCCELLISCGGGASLRSPHQTNNETPKLTQIKITPANRTIPLGTQLQLSATGTFSDGTQTEISSAVNWQATPATIATISAAGSLAGVGVGVAQVSAAYKGLSGSVSVTVGSAGLVGIAVNPKQSLLRLGQSEPLKATGSFSDGTSQDLTQAVTWQALPSSVAAISKAGQLTGIGKGIAQISATYQAFSDVSSVTVGSAGLIAISVTPPSTSLPLGESAALNATGTFTDGTMQNLTSLVTWVSSAPAIATVSPAGAVAAKAVGAAMLSANLESVTGTSQLTVTPAVAAVLHITPATSPLGLGFSGRLQALATFSDGTTLDVTATATWTSLQPEIVAVNTGVVTGQRVGSTTITAESNSLASSSVITVTPIMTVSYFNLANAVSANYDSTLTLVDPGVVAGDMCSMIYVFDRNQEMNECCGCKISDSGMRTLSLIHDLTANTLTGKEPVAGTIQIVPSDLGPNGLCNAASPAPDGVIAGWETNIQASGTGFETTETATATNPLSNMQASVLASECGMIQRLGSGAGICSCGTGN